MAVVTSYQPPRMRRRRRRRLAAKFWPAHLTWQKKKKRGDDGAKKEDSLEVGGRAGLRIYPRMPAYNKLDEGVKVCPSPFSYTTTPRTRASPLGYNFFFSFRRPPSPRGPGAFHYLSSEEEEGGGRGEEEERRPSHMLKWRQIHALPLLSSDSKSSLGEDWAFICEEALRPGDCKCVRKDNVSALPVPV